MDTPVDTTSTETKETKKEHLADQIAAARKAREIAQGKRKPDKVAEHPAAEKALAKLGRRKAPTVAKPAPQPKVRSKPKEATKTRPSSPKDPKPKISGESTGWGKGSTPPTHCSVCGKPISRADSVSQGMGDVCAHRSTQLNGVSWADHYASHTVSEIPAGYVQFKEAVEFVRSKGYSAYRLLQAMGGKRMMYKPLPHFESVYYHHTFFVNGEFKQHLKDLDKR